MARRRFFRRIFALALAVVIVAPMSLGGLAKLDQNDPLQLAKLLNPPAPAKEKQAAANDNDPVITAARRTHILHGDRSGGGHLYGTGKPCKSEFPASWDAQKIISTVEQAAANDNIPWKQQSNGYYVADIMSENLRIRIVLDENQGEVVTAYPVNVPRNPCPANDNRY